MSYTIEPQLDPVSILDLRPTQITVGMREVEEKRKRLQDKAKNNEAAKFVGTHLLPVVLGPKKRSYILDHHHLALALHLEKVEHVLTSVVADLSALKKDAFWYVMAHRNWMHIYDASGTLCSVGDIPKTVEGLVDDPFRSLAGELRRVGGYAKDTTLYSEFLWADFLRRSMKRKPTGSFEAALEEALALAKSEAAGYLPGWCGAEKDA